MITFADQEALDRYVRRVMTAQLELNERSALNSIAMIGDAAEPRLAPAALDAIKIAVRVVFATQRATLTLPLPVVPK